MGHKKSPLTVLEGQAQLVIWLAGCSFIPESRLELAKGRYSDFASSSQTFSQLDRKDLLV